MPYPVVHWKKYVQGGKDAYGKPKDSWVAPVPIRADFAPTRSEEPRDGLTTRVVYNAQLVLDKPIDYDPRDKFLVDGVEYEAEGVGGTWWGRYSRRMFGQVIEIRRPDG